MIDLEKPIKVRLIAEINHNNNSPIVALIRNPDSSVHVATYTKEGKFINMEN